MWIYEHSDWPNFIWDSNTLEPLLGNTHRKLGLFLGKASNLGLELGQEAQLITLTDDALKSSAIEGEHLHPDHVRSSIAKTLGLDIAGLPEPHRNVVGTVEMMLDATQNFSEPLTKERLSRWHAALFSTQIGMFNSPSVIGDWRSSEDDPMQVVSGAVGKEKVHFKAPDAEKVDGEMDKFLSWFEGNQEVDTILKAGVAHYWFVTIHPFEDGNGRIGRAIMDMALARADGTKKRFYSLSRQIEFERKDYYSALEKQSLGTPDITQWLQWFINCLSRSVDSSEKTLSRVLFKAGLWETMRDQEKVVNERQSLVINKMLSMNWKGHINRSKYSKLCKCSPTTAQRDMKELQDWGILVQNEGRGRSTSYRLTDTLPG